MSQTVNGSESSRGVQAEEKSFFQVIAHSFFIIPFLIAVFCVLLFGGVYLLTREQRGVYDYLEDVKTGGLTKRWQGAFELSKILANPDLIPKEERFSSEMINAFEKAKHDDPRVRQYLAFAMGRTKDKEFVRPLTDGLSDENQGCLPAIIYALGMIGERKSAPALYPFTENGDSRIRSIAVAALGSIADPASIKVLQKSLDDAEPNVQWGAAVSLARMEDASGKAVLGRMLDREYWSQFPEVDFGEKNDLLLMALEAAAKLNDSDLDSRIHQLAQSDLNMKVRAKALDLSTASSRVKN
jgi:HEAT repeat protein